MKKNIRFDESFARIISQLLKEHSEQGILAEPCPACDKQMTFSKDSMDKKWWIIRCADHKCRFSYHRLPVKPIEMLDLKSSTEAELMEWMGAFSAVKGISIIWLCRTPKPEVAKTIISLKEKDKEQMISGLRRLIAISLNDTNTNFAVSILYELNDFRLETDFINVLKDLVERKREKAVLIDSIYPAIYGLIRLGGTKGLRFLDHCMRDPELAEYIGIYVEEAKACGGVIDWEEI